MKKLIGIAVLSLSASAVSVEGYNDIYIDKSNDIVVHGIMCADNLDNLSKLKPALVYTNTPNIEKGTYYFQSAYGEYSLTFNTTENPIVMVRARLQDGNTAKEDAQIKLCLVKDSTELPEALRAYLQKNTLRADDENWEGEMKKYQLVAGSPAVGKGKY